MKLLPALVGFCLPLLLVASASAVTRDFRATWAGVSASGTVSADYRVYAPSPVDAPRLKGLIFICPGSAGDWRYRAEEAVWQEAARALDFGLIGFGSNASYFSKTEPESRAMIDAILAGAAQVLGRPELVNAPIIVTGFSLGGWVSTDLLNKVPERVVTVIPQHGGDGFSAPDPVAARRVPLLYIPGSVDTNGLTNPQVSAQHFVTYRGPSAPNGLAAFAVDWQTPHDSFTNQGWAMLWVWIAEIVKLRYPTGEFPSEAPGNPLSLLDLNESDGWLAQRAYVTSTTGADRSPFVQIAPYASYAGDKANASWLPNEAAARVYRAFASFDGKARSEIPLQGPLAITGDAAPVALVPGGQTQITVWPVGSTVTIKVDPREFDDIRSIVSVEFYDGATHVATLTTPTANGWIATRYLDTRGIRGFSVVATDSAGNKSSAFRTVVVAAPYQIPDRPLLQFQFNEEGSICDNTGSDGTAGVFMNSAGEAADLHGAPGSGVSGRPHDRAMDNRSATGMGSAGIGGGMGIGDLTLLDGLTSFTLQGWLKTEVPINGVARIFEKNFGAGTSGFVLRAGSSPGQLVLQVNSRSVTSEPAYGDIGKWVFFAVSYDALKSEGNVRFFVGSDGDSVRSVGSYTLNGGSVAANVTWRNAIPLIVGNNSGTTGFTNNRPLKGLLDNLRIFSTNGGSRGLLSLDELEAIRISDLKGEELPVSNLTLEGGPALHFRSSVGRYYQLQRSLNLEPGSWTTVSPVWDGAGSVLKIEDRSPVSSDRLFYRLLVSP